MLINNRKDLDAAPADERTRFMAQLGGTIHKWRWNDTEWEQYADTSAIERFGFAVTDFPDAPVPPMPEMSPKEQEAERKREEMAGMSVTRRQGKQQLLVDGLLDSVQPAIDAIPDELTRKMVQIYWDDAQDFDRNNEQLIGLAEALGLTPEQTDQLFIKAEER